MVRDVDAASLRNALLGLLTKQPRKRASSRAPAADLGAPGDDSGHAATHAQAPQTPEAESGEPGRRTKVNGQGRRRRRLDGQRRARERAAVLASDSPTTSGSSCSRSALSLLLFSLRAQRRRRAALDLLDVVALLPPPGSGKMLISELPAQVKVTLRGSRSQAEQPVARRAVADPDRPARLPKGDASTAITTSTRRRSTSAATCSVTEISPAMVPLTWAEAGERRVPVQVAARRRARQAAQTAQATSRSTRATSRCAAREALRALNTVSTEPVSLVGLEIGEHTAPRAARAAAGARGVRRGQRGRGALVVDQRSPSARFRRLEVGALGEGASSCGPTASRSRCADRRIAGSARARRARPAH